MQARSKSQISYLLVGNPGVGKSTFLNGLIGSLKFQSGTSVGEGKTKFLQVEEDADGNQFIDTPGLDDVKNRAPAADEIAKALKIGGDHMILVFFITLESGRVRSSDLLTMKLILEGGKVTSNHFAIVINKITKTVMKEIKGNEENYNRLFVVINQALPAKTSHIYLNAFRLELEDEDNMVPEMSSELKKFIEDCPSVTISTVDPNFLNTPNWKIMKEEADQQIIRIAEVKVDEILTMKNELEKELLQNAHDPSQEEVRTIQKETQYKSIQDEQDQAEIPRNSMEQEEEQIWKHSKGEKEGQQESAQPMQSKEKQEDAPKNKVDEILTMKNELEKELLPNAHDPSQEEVRTIQKETQYKSIQDEQEQEEIPRNSMEQEEEQIWKHSKGEKEGHQESAQPMQSKEKQEDAPKNYENYEFSEMQEELKHSNKNGDCETLSETHEKNMKEPLKQKEMNELIMQEEFSKMKEDQNDDQVTQVTESILQ
jgi:GTPase SAR1 family protein